jgi:hypothetical protein
MHIKLPFIVVDNQEELWLSAVMDRESVLAAGRAGVPCLLRVADSVGAGTQTSEGAPPLRNMKRGGP